MQRGDNAFTLGFTDAVDNQLYRRHQGAERISEVSARFTLDAMPGKQMAIDADLNAGLINQAQAQTRRKDVASEADFYGAMDGHRSLCAGTPSPG